MSKYKYRVIQTEMGFKAQYKEKCNKFICFCDYYSIRHGMSYFHPTLESAMRSITEHKQQNPEPFENIVYKE